MIYPMVPFLVTLKTLNLDFKVLNVLCAQLTRVLFAIAMFLFQLLLVLFSFQLQLQLFHKLF